MHDSYMMPMSTISQQTCKENQKIVKIVDRVLKQIFGNEATRLIYRYLESRYALKPDEIADKIDLFAKGLEEFLRTGAYAIERKILEDIYSSYGLLRRLELEKMRSEDFASQIRMLMRRA